MYAQMLEGGVAASVDFANVMGGCVGDSHSQQWQQARLEYQHHRDVYPETKRVDSGLTIPKFWPSAEKVKRQA